MSILDLLCKQICCHVYSSSRSDRACLLMLTVQVTCLTDITTHFCVYIGILSDQKHLLLFYSMKEFRDFVL